MTSTLPKKTRLNPPTKKFIGKLALDCASRGITFKLLKSTTLRTGSVRFSGSFDGKTLSVASGDESSPWLEVLVHESCHLDQALGKVKVWETIGKSIEKVDRWLTDPSISSRGIKTAFYRIIKMELDCERRSVRKIRANNLPISVDEYIQRANSYLLSHHISLKNRSSKYTPRSERVWPFMPKVFLSQKQYLNPPENLLRLFGKILVS